MAEGNIKSRDEILARNEQIRKEQMEREEKLEAKKRFRFRMSLIGIGAGVITLVVGILLLRQPKELGGQEWQFAIVLAGFVITLLASFTAASMAKKSDDDSGTGV